MGNKRFRERIKNSKDVLGESGYMINWPFGGEQKEKTERDQVFKGTSMAVEKSADGQNETHENWKVPVKFPFPVLKGGSPEEGGFSQVSLPQTPSSI